MHRTGLFYLLPLILVMAMSFSVKGAEDSTSDVPYPGTYTCDMPHSYVGFSVKHLIIATVKGCFKEFSGAVMFDPENLAASSVEVSADVLTPVVRVVRQKSESSIDLFGQNHPCQLVRKSHPG